MSEAFNFSEAVNDARNVSLHAMSNDFGWGAIGLVVGAIITGLFGWLVQWSKSRSDQETAVTAAQAAVEVAVMAEWQKLNAALSKRVSDLEEELAKVRTEHAAEIEKIRRIHADEIDEMRTKHRAEMKVMRQLNEGLQRQITQNSQSTAHLLGKSPVTKEPPDGK